MPPGPRVTSVPDVSPGFRGSPSREPRSHRHELASATQTFRTAAERSSVQSSVVPSGFRGGEEIELNRRAEAVNPTRAGARGGGLGREPGIEQLYRDGG